MVVDDAQAFVMSLNWETRNVTETRDYAVVTTRREGRGGGRRVLRRRLAAQAFTPHEGSALIWCNTNGRERFAHFIDAREALAVAAERALPGRRDHRARGARRAPRRQGPHHRAPAAHAEGGEADRRRRRPAHHGGRRRQGAQAKGLRLHGKMLLADGARAIVGSVNLAPGSFDARRELAIEVDDAHVVEPLEKIAKHDWDHSEAARPHRRGPDGRSREARQGRRRGPRARRASTEDRALAVRNATRTGSPAIAGEEPALSAADGSNAPGCNYVAASVQLGGQVRAIRL